MCALSSQVFTVIFSFSFLYPASRLIRGVVFEKEAKIREGVFCGPTALPYAPPAHHLRSPCFAAWSHCGCAQA